MLGAAFNAAGEEGKPMEYENNQKEVVELDADDTDEEAGRKQDEKNKSSKRRRLHMPATDEQRRERVWLTISSNRAVYNYVDVATVTAVAKNAEPQSRQQIFMNTGAMMCKLCNNGVAVNLCLGNLTLRSQRSTLPATWRTKGRIGICLPRWRSGI